MSIDTARPLVFEGRLSEDDVVLIRRYRWLMVFRPAVRWAGVAALTLLAAALVWWSLRWGSVVCAALFGGMWAYALLILPAELRWTVRRHYRKNESQFLKSRVTLAEDQVILENAANRSFMSWSLVGLIANAPEGLLFCNRELGVMFWLPQRVLIPDGCRERVLEMAAEKGVQIRQMP